MLIARARAEESDREDALFRDPLAGGFLDAAGLPDGLDRVNDFGGPNFVLRTRYFDDQLLDAAEAGCRQVVLLAAGLDTRAFRLPWPDGTRLFELDLPELLSFKERVIAESEAAPACERAVVRADLRDDWSVPLLDAGFQPNEPTAWLAEGLLMFLRPEDNDRLLARIGSLSPPGSRLALEHVNRAFHQSPDMRAVHRRFALIQASWYATVEDPRAWLAGHGWRARVQPGEDLARRLGRPVPRVYDPEHLGSGRIWLVSAQRATD
ncbi:SAM-dependent methyltransferase [Gandjariella thermophila]|nr:SAM-dependent methyltransferase [Gandjariella thermophila]